MFTYILFLIAVVFTVANACILHKFDNRDIRNVGDIFFFNGGLSIAWILVLSLFSLISGDFRISAGSAFYGTVYGIIICLFLLFKNLALTSGPVSLSTLIGSCPFILTTIYGVIFMNQDINAMQILGMVMIMISLTLCVCPKKGERISGKWLIFSALFFLAGGGVGIIYMLFGASNAATEINGMMLCAACVATVLYFATGLIINASKKSPTPKIYKSGIAFILLSGIASCTYMRMNLYLSTVIPSVVFFPLSNGSVVILSTISGMLLFKERLNKAQILGMIIGLAALVITGIA